MKTNRDQPRLRLLLVDVDHDFFAKVILLLEEVAPRRFVLEWAQTYSFAVGLMRRQQFILCLASSHIGHRSGNDLVADMRIHGCDTPVILLTDRDGWDVPEGQPVDCLDRDRLSSEMLRRAIRDAMFRSLGGSSLAATFVQPAMSDTGRAVA